MLTALESEDISACQTLPKRHCVTLVDTLEARETPDAMAKCVEYSQAVACQPPGSGVQEAEETSLKKASPAVINCKASDDD